MISTFLVEHTLLVRIGFWSVTVAAAVLTWSLHRLRLRSLLLGLSAAAFVAVLVLTLLPDGTRPGGVTCTAQFSIPFHGIETLANLAMMLPLALFLGTATNRPVTAFAAVTALSAVIEAVQALVPMLGRRCDTNDWLMNTIGALLGAIIAVAIITLNQRFRPTTTRKQPNVP